MKKTVGYLLLSFAISIFAFSSCSKYEEGPASLASKKSRLVNQWKIKALTLNGIDWTPWKTVTAMTVTENNTVTFFGEFLNFPTTLAGTWMFSEDKMNVLVTTSDGELLDYEIIMLQKDESKFRLTDVNGDVYLYHFVSK